MIVDSLASWIIGIWVVWITVWNARRNEAVAGAAWRAIFWSAAQHTVDGSGEDARR